MLHQITSFVMKHWMLVAAFLGVFILIVIEEIRSQHASGQRITPFMATQLMNRENAVVMDTRDAAAFRAGHIVNAKNFPVVDLEHQQEKWLSYRDRPVIVVDANGLKAPATALKLKQAGLNQVVILKGGMETWVAEGLPIVK